MSNEPEQNVLVPQEYIDDEKGKMNTLEFCINLMKGIAGTGSLALPFAFSQVGIICGIILFVVVCGMMILATWQLVQLNKEIIEDHPNDYKEIMTNNTYAELVYKALGSVGYWIYYVCSLITLYGSNIGSMVVMTDFLEAIPIGSNRKLRRVISQVILTLLCILLCLLKDPKMLVAVSSLGLYAIAAGFLAMIIFGFIEYPFKFEVSDLWPRSISAFLQNFGIIVYCMGFILFLLTQYKYLRRDCKKTVVRSTGISISLMAVLYSVVGILIALIYKNGPHGVQGNILQSLPDGTWLAIPVNLLMVITVIGGFPLWMEPVNEMVEGHWGPCTKGKYFITNPVYIVFRIVEIVCISLVAYFVPFFEDILSVVGNFSDVITTFMFPAVMHLWVFRKVNTWGIKLMDWATLIFSTFIMVVCTTLSMKSLIEQLMHKA
ncbi:uncharacterized protein [Blastocystis hominis]|uniref:Amino acid transporter transmembrane domain-containing protein n=1 Tax=Blastocystis hominis TaxID=12968 RepID=D8M0X5_BLAHO|nr:uncharacterized protein [Blastocystis hominis]CBK21714.2 unnamed protein product [Blastocystis hominis]|eukprot:XP_012895762.1 uncharacterized protein [Blastocystis hominis]